MVRHNKRYRREVSERKDEKEKRIKAKRGKFISICQIIFNFQISFMLHVGGNIEGQKWKKEKNERKKKWEKIHFLWFLVWSLRVRTAKKVKYFWTEVEMSPGNSQKEKREKRKRRGTEMSYDLITWRRRKLSENTNTIEANWIDGRYGNRNFPQIFEHWCCVTLIHIVKTVIERFAVMENYVYQNLSFMCSKALRDYMQKQIVYWKNSNFSIKSSMRNMRKGRNCHFGSLTGVLVWNRYSRSVIALSELIEVEKKLWRKIVSLRKV